MDEKYIVVNSNGLNVRSQKSTTNPYNFLRSMSYGEGFTVFETYIVKGSTGLQKWGRISDNPGGISQEYVCLSIGNKEYAKKESGDMPPVTPPVVTPPGVEARVTSLETRVAALEAKSK